MSRLTGYLLVIFFCLVILIAFSHSKDLNNDSNLRLASSQTQKDILKIVHQYQVKELDPFLATDTGSARVIVNVFEGLTRFKPGTAMVEPCLANSWEVSEDGLEWTFHLRKNVFFHDGTTFDAKAVELNVARAKNKKNAHTNYADFVYAPVKQIEVIDQYTVKFYLKYPYAPLLNNLAMPMGASMVSPKAINSDRSVNLPSGTGPYILTEHNQDMVLLKANQRYWRTPPLVRIAELTTVPSMQKRIDLLLQERADIALDLDFANTADLRLQGYPVFSTTGLDICYLGFYTDKKPFAQTNARQAVALALNRETIINELWLHEIRPALGPLPPTVTGFNAVAEVGSNQGTASDLLKAAGHPEGLSFTLITYTDSRPYTPGGGKALADKIATSLAKSNIEVQVRAYEWDSFKKALQRREGDAFIYGWISDNADPDNFLYTLLAESQIDSGLNLTRYRNAGLNTLLESGRSTNDPEIRRQIYSQAQQIISTEVPFVALNHSLHHAATSRHIQGFVLSPTEWPALHDVIKNKL